MKSGYDSLISSESLHELLMNGSELLIVDCRFELSDTDAGTIAYHHSHIPAAIYAHLDDDLSGPPITNQGRHPLPTDDALTALFSRWGLTPETQLVAYDNMNGALAARLWWMARYMSHDKAAVLDGGWAAWAKDGFPIENSVPEIRPTQFRGSPRRDWLVDLDQVQDAHLLIDSRAPDRYRGEVEPLDPVAGHIPGATNYFFQNNWGAGGRYLSSDELRQQFEGLLGNTPSEEAVFYCGSGVTACANILSQAIAGMPLGKLYAGSWGEWSTLGMPVEKN